jgi:hypothetical protein
MLQSLRDAVARRRGRRTAYLAYDDLDAASASRESDAARSSAQRDRDHGSIYSNGLRRQDSSRGFGSGGV